MGDTFIFIMGLVCTGAVVAATFLSINELKDVNEPQLETMDMAEGTKKHLKLISTLIPFLGRLKKEIGLVSLITSLSILINFLSYLFVQLNILQVFPNI